MKILCYFVLFIAFFVYYQQEPMFTLIVVALMIGVYLFFKVKKQGLGLNFTRGIFGSGAVPMSDSSSNLLPLILYQQAFLGNSVPSSTPSKEVADIEQEEEKERLKKIDETKNRILQLLASD